MKRYYIIAGAVLGFFIIVGLAMKSVGTPQNRTEKQGRISTAMNKLVGQSDNSTIAFQKNERAPMWGALKTVASPKIQTTTFNGAVKPVDSDKDKSKKSKDKKKKKQAKKKKKKPTTTAKKAQPESSDENTDADLSLAMAGGGAFTPEAKKKKDPNAIPETLEEWEQYILHPPSMDHLLKFISYYQAKLIKDEIFYTLCETMIAAPQENIRKFGIIALGSTPSVFSFALLNQASTNERSGQLQSLIETNFQTYLAVQFVSYMGPSLSSVEDNVRYQAAITIWRSAEMNIRRTQTDEESTGRGRTGTRHSYTRIYQTFIPQLTRALQTETNESVKAQMQKALDLLNPLVVAAR